jgi:magnesium chelatase family protein
MVGPNDSLIRNRPFRAPHHTISDAGLIGGGRTPKPGEVSLAHNGVLFLDELPEFRKNVLEALRQPVEEGKVTISRSQISLTFPARFMLAAAMNPCPCGYRGDSAHECKCGVKIMEKYWSKISGPLLDRIDIQIEAPPVKWRELTAQNDGESSEAVRLRVEKARELQLKRLKGLGVYSNAQMNEQQVKKICVLDSHALSVLEKAVSALGLSARAYHRILKISRTIADLSEQDRITSEHVAEAIQYRSLDRRMF